MRCATMLPLSGVLLLLALGIAACGVSGAGAGTAGPTPGSAALNGCPIQRAPVGWSPADVVLTAGGAQGATVTPSGDFITHVAVRRGQTIDVRLGATIQWRITAAPDAAVLSMAQPAGWYDTGQRACVWRFTAVGAGATRLALSGGLVCPPRTACPALAAIARYEIVVR